MLSYVFDDDVIDFKEIKDKQLEFRDDVMCQAKELVKIFNEQINFVYNKYFGDPAVSTENLRSLIGTFGELKMLHNINNMYRKTIVGYDYAIKRTSAEKKYNYSPVLIKKKFDPDKKPTFGLDEGDSSKQKDWIETNDAWKINDESYQSMLAQMPPMLVAAYNKENDFDELFNKNICYNEFESESKKSIEVVINATDTISDHIDGDDEGLFVNMTPIHKYIWNRPEWNNNVFLKIIVIDYLDSIENNNKILGDCITVVAFATSWIPKVGKAIAMLINIGGAINALDESYGRWSIIKDSNDCILNKGCKIVDDADVGHTFSIMVADAVGLALSFIPSRGVAKAGRNITEKGVKSLLNSEIYRKLLRIYYKRLFKKLSTIPLDNDYNFDYRDFEDIFLRTIPFYDFINDYMQDISDTKGIYFIYRHFDELDTQNKKR